MSYIVYETLLASGIRPPLATFHEADPIDPRRMAEYYRAPCGPWHGLWDDNHIWEEGVLRFIHDDLLRGYRALNRGDYAEYHALKNGFVERNGVTREGLR